MTGRDVRRFTINPPTNMENANPSAIDGAGLLGQVELQPFCGGCGRAGAAGDPVERTILFPFFYCNHGIMQWYRPVLSYY